MNAAVELKLKNKLDATHVFLEDESAQHKHHREGGSGHFCLTIVSPQFTGKSILQQHRLVYAALAEEMQTTIHALAIRSYTPETWEQRGG